MHVHVALTPAEFPGLALGDRAAVVVDVLRATTTLVAPPPRFETGFV